MGGSVWVWYLLMSAPLPGGTFSCGTGPAGLAGVSPALLAREERAPKSHAVRGPVGRTASWCAMCEAATDAGVEVTRRVIHAQAEKARTTRVTIVAAEKGLRPKALYNEPGPCSALAY